MAGPSRRELLLAGAAASAALAAPGGAAETSLVAARQSTDGVMLPPGGDVMLYSFDWPEPSVGFGGLEFAFEVITVENRCAVDPATIMVSRSTDGLEFTATGLTMAGGQLRAAGRIDASLRRGPDGSIEWTVSARAPAPIKAIKTIVRGLPRGRLSAAAKDWMDPGDDLKVFEYPTLFGGMATPLVTIDGTDGRVWALSSLQAEVRPARFAFWPGPAGYKVELVAETAEWARSTHAAIQKWRIGSGPDFAAATRAHFDHVRDAWRLPGFAGRTDAPAWMKHLALVVTLHGQHWSGRILNDYARQREILIRLAGQMDPRNVMVFLAGWDGRYYWDYPAFRPDARMGGEAGLKALIDTGRRLGFRFALMFGSNVANPASPLFPAMAKAELRDAGGRPIPANYVDWDSDWRGDGCMTFMNLAVDAWRDHLAGRIEAMTRQLGTNAYFLDICGLWENNAQGDMLAGTRALVETLARRLPGIPPIAEMQYDAQMGFIPMSQVPRYHLQPTANYDHVASFEHLSHPAPGRGSTGIHEAGFGTYRPVTLEQRQIPTITFADTTLDRDWEAVRRDVAVATARFRARGDRT